MKTHYLVQLNRPVVIEDSYHGAAIKQTIYGFLGPYDEQDDTKNTYHEDNFYYYCEYLAAMHQWTENGGKEFHVIDKEWYDLEGNPLTCEERESICRRDKKRLNLDYTLYVIELDDTTCASLESGMQGNLIIGPNLMDRLVDLALQQGDDLFKLRNVILFNRPIWLPKHILWDGTKGYCHIYGLTIDRSLEQKNLDQGTFFLGYLAMIEELTLNGVTPSGYTANIEKDGNIWYDHGEAYPVNSAKIKKECHLCRSKNNLKICDTVEAVPWDDLADGVRSGYIISQELYEDLLDGRLD